jgi:hypothetical protein
LETERLTTRLLARIRTNRDEMLAKTNFFKKKKIEVNQKIETSQEEKYSRIGTLFFWMDIHKATIEVIQEEISAKMDAHKERIEASMNAW